MTVSAEKSTKINTFFFFLLSFFLEKRELFDTGDFGGCAFEKGFETHCPSVASFAELLLPSGRKNEKNEK